MKLDKDSRKISKKLFAASFTEGRLDAEKISAIARKVGETKPRHALNILKEFQRRVRLEAAKHHAIVESAVGLDNDTTAQLIAGLRAKYGPDLTTEFTVSPELLGGLRIKIGSDVIDSSVRDRLKRLETEFACA